MNKRRGMELIGICSWPDRKFRCWKFWVQQMWRLFWKPHCQRNVSGRNPREKQFFHEFRNSFCGSRRRCIGGRGAGTNQWRIRVSGCRRLSDSLRWGAGTDQGLCFLWKTVTDRENHDIIRPNAVGSKGVLCPDGCWRKNKRFYMMEEISWGLIS